MDNPVNNNLEIIHYNFYLNKKTVKKVSYKININKLCSFRITKARLEKSLTIGELSIQSNIEKSYISVIELGKHTPTINTLKKLSTVLDKEHWWLGGFDKLPQKTLGERIYKCRLFSGYTQNQFAKILDVLPETIRKWEKDISHPSKSNLEKLKKYLNLIP